MPVIIYRTLLLILACVMAPACSLRFPYDMAATPVEGKSKSYKSSEEDLDKRYKELKHKLLEFATVSDAMKSQRDRNDLLDEYMRIADSRYQRFTIEFHRNTALRRNALDIISIGLSAAASVSGGAAGQAMSAADTGIKGVQGSIDTRWLADKQIELLVKAMDAQRALRKAIVLQNMTKPYSEYSLDDGLREIDEYHQTSSLIEALTYLSDKMGEQNQQNQRTLDLAKKGIFIDSFSSDATGDALQRFWKPDGQAINSENEKLLKQWMEINDIPVSIPSFIHGSTHTAERQRAVTHFKLPLERPASQNPDSPPATTERAPSTLPTQPQ